MAISEELKSCVILVIDVIKDLISSRKRKNIYLKHEIAKNHPDIAIEKRVVNSIIRNRADLTGLKKSKKKRLSYKKNKDTRIKSDQTDNDKSRQ